MLFKTAPDKATNFSFVVGGDSQDLNLFSGRNEFSDISCTMAKFNPSFVVHCGDLVHKGNDQNHWNIWFEDVSENWTSYSSPSEISSDGEGRIIPVIPVLGNHEKNDSKYYLQFALPNNEQWYYYDWANVRIIVLNSDALPSQIKEDQTVWLEDVLKSTPSSMWKMVFFHRNVYGAAGWYDSDEIIDYWIPLFDKYDVTAVFNGHIHNYHRYKPMKDNKVVSSYKGGTLYITTGGWGSSLTEYHEKPYSAYGRAIYHFVLVSVYNNVSIHIEAKDIEGETFDSVWLSS